MKTKTKETVNMQTGEITTPKLGEVIHVEYRRPDGSLRVAQDFSNCPTLAEQHTAHLTNVNYLVEKYRPDELAAYMAARNQYRREILGHDFSLEPNLQEAKNIIYQSKQEFEKLPDEVKRQFQNHLEFLKFVDNPANAKKLIELGIVPEETLNKIKIPDPASKPNPEPNQTTSTDPNQKNESKTKN